MISVTVNLVGHMERWSTWQMYRTKVISWIYDNVPMTEFNLIDQRSNIVVIFYRDEDATVFKLRFKL